MKHIICFILLASLSLFSSAMCADTEALPREAITVLITCVGDCTLGGVANHTASSEKMFAKAVDTNGYEWFLEDVRTVFEADDFENAYFEMAYNPMASLCDTFWDVLMQQFEG